MKNHPDVIDDPTPMDIVADYGDAPSSYGDALHGVIPTIYLGSTEPDSESETQ